MDTKGIQLFIEFDRELSPLRHWPQNKDFPLNLKDFNRSAVEIIDEDLKQTFEFLIITGFTSLSFLIDTFGKENYPKLEKVKIALGFEPNRRGRKRYCSIPLDKEIKEFWLKQELSILQGGSLINLIEKIKRKKVEFRFKDKLHAKIYVSDHASILGSSNFSKNGLSLQTEANIRFTKTAFPEKHQDIEKIAENFYSDASPYPHIIDLLKALIQQVTWQEALARAIVEVLEGDWLRDYKTLFSTLEKTKLWRTQWEGLGQAMTILQENSNVLIADPTGSGKTKLCAAIILAMKHWLWENGRHFKDNSVIVCPPLVKNKWAKEFRELSNNSDSQISMGILSAPLSENKKNAIEQLETANILAIDEAHNYLNIQTSRSKALRLNSADFKILITATPISRKTDDLLRLVELLDLDNLSDESFKTYEALISKPHLQQETDLETFKRFISKFTVRRTKNHLNKLIDKEENAYKNKLNENCRFPEQTPEFYPTLETKTDQATVIKINFLAKKLKGITYSKNLKKPSFELGTAEKIQEYVDNRFKSSRALAIYNVRSSLRSSHVALYEHIYGTDKCLSEFKFDSSKKINKARYQTISKIIANNEFPTIDSVFENSKIPLWYLNKDLFINACIEEIKIYDEIGKLIPKLSNARELGKVKLLTKILEEHDKIVAFDSTVITLNYFLFLFKKHYPKINVLLATGSSKDGSKKVLSQFTLTSENEEKTIALCSDKMSEGVDLQKASAVVLLDMPSVLRLVEQRLGRIDRMDSLYPKITTYWPNDSEIYSLKGDERLIKINQFVEKTIGSNIEIPKEFSDRHFRNTGSAKELHKEFSEYLSDDKSWKGIQNSFQPVYDLKEGAKAIIAEEDYNQFLNVKTTIKTRVSFLDSQTEWCFFALRGGERKSPKWFFIEKYDKGFHYYTDFPEICIKLREHTKSVSNSKNWNDRYLKKYVKILQEKEIDILSPKKKRAIRVAEILLQKKIKGRKDNAVMKGLMRNILKLFHNQNNSIDFDRFADMWIKILQPHLENKRKRTKSKRQVFNLNSLIKGREPSNIQFEYQDLNNIYENCPVTENINSKIASCIIGIPNKGN